MAIFSNASDHHQVTGNSNTAATHPAIAATIFNQLFLNRRHTRSNHSSFECTFLALSMLLQNCSIAHQYAVASIK